MEGVKLELDVGKRMDALPVTALHLMLVVLCGLGLAVDMFEMVLGSVLSAVFSAPPHELAPKPLALLLSSVYLGAIVGAACNGRVNCSYKAPTEAEYRRMGVQAATRTFCTQGMEIVYRCGPDVRPGATSQSFYASFFRESGIKTKQRKPNGKEWDYIVEGGVSHYGLMPEFLHEVKQENAAVYENVMSSADAFVRMWKKIESVRGAVRP